MTRPTANVIQRHLARHGVTTKNQHTWAQFLHGLDWPLIKPLVSMAVSSRVHPALAVGMVIRSTKDEGVRATLTQHLEAKDK